MICPVTNRECKTNGCGEKCYKRDSLGYSVSQQFAEVMQHHYRCRMAQAATAAEWNFCSDCYNHYTNEINKHLS